MRSVAWRIVGAIALTVFGAWRVDAQPSPISIFVFTSTAAPTPTPQEAERIEVTRMLKRSLPDDKKITMPITVTDTRDEATLIIEVTGAERQDRVSSRSRFEEMVSPVYQATAALSYGSYKTGFVIHATDASYKRTVNMGRMNSSPALDEGVGNLIRIKAASSLSAKVHDWIEQNKDDLRKPPQ